MDRRRKTWPRTAVALTTLLLTMAAARVAAADTMTLMWDPSSGPNIAGYIVYIGNQPGAHTQSVDVGPATSYVFSSAMAGQQYCFAVSAYTTGAVEGTKSGDVCGYSNQYPTLTIPGTQSSVAGQSDSLQLQGSDPDGQPVTYSATGLPTGLTVGTSTGFISGTPTTAGNYTVTATVSDSVLTASQTFAWNVSAGDTTAPSISITGPTSASTYSTTSATLNLSGTASDAVGVTQVSWANDRGGSGNATGTTNWSVSGIALQSGTNVLTVTARDAAGNTSTDSLTVTYTAADSVAPVVAITGPTSAATYTTSTAFVTLSGTASDNVGVTLVTWSNDRGGSGNAAGTGSWMSSAITLQSGTNVLTVTARDAANNTVTARLTVTFNPPPDTTAPFVTITSPTSASTYATGSATVGLSGSASDNIGVTQVSWANDRGGSGNASGTTSWTASGVTLQSGANVIAVTSRDAAGNTATDTLTVTYTPPDTTAPVVSISSPTSASSHTTTSSSITLAGTASDAVGVTQVTWQNSRGGSGTATGTTSWTAGSITLLGGSNVLTITARDAAGNAAITALTVTYNAPDTTAPSITIAQPTSASTFTTANSTVNISGSASDAVGVTQVTWSNNRGGSGSATGTTGWSVSGVTLADGANIITVTARDAAGNTGTDVLTVDSVRPLALTSLTANRPAPQPTGTSITFTATASGGTAPYQFKWWVQSGGVWSVGQNWSSNATFTWQPSSEGTYMVAVWARNAGVTADASQALDQTPYVISKAVSSGGGTLAITSLTSDLSSPQVPGSTITFTAGAAGGVAPYQFKWWVQSGGVWSVAREWSSTPTFSWRPTTPGTYMVAVWGRNASTTADVGEALAQVPYVISSGSTSGGGSGSGTALAITSLTSDLSSPQAAGSTITFTAGAAGGAAPYQFKWWVQSGGVWLVVREWSSTPTLSWRPTTPGSYIVAVWARNAGVTADASQALAQVPFVISPGSSSGTTPLSITGLTSNLASPQAPGASITFAASASGGSAPYQFKWWVQSAGVWAVAQNWSTSASFTWRPPSTGTYVVAVWARNAGVTADASQAMSQTTYLITSSGTAPLSVAGLWSSVSGPQRVGTTIGFTASASGGTAPYQFKWWVYDGIEWSVAQNWSSSATLSWRPTRAGSYIVAVWARNAGVTADAAQAFQQVTYVISP